MITRPDPSEFASFYAGYIGKVPDSGPTGLLRAQLGSLEKLRYLSEDKANYAYADGKWSVKEVIGHVADGERVFSYRLTRIARGDTTPLAGFDENAWAKAAPHRRRGRRDARRAAIDDRPGGVAGRRRDRESRRCQ